MPHENFVWRSRKIYCPNCRQLVIGYEGKDELIVETMMTSSEKILIASNWYPSSLVKSKFMKLNYHHIQYVLDMLRSNTTKVRNIKKYILASLFNAPTTIESYYRAEVNHDFPQYAAAK